MKPGSIQLLQLFFKHVRVEVDATHMPSELANPLTSAFVFDGINIGTEFGIVEIDPSPERGRMFLVSLRVVVDNKPIPKAEGQLFSAYKFDVEVNGIVAVPPGAERLGMPKDLAAVNGASLLWSAIREQVVALTARMPAGPVMLPTVHFQDLKKEDPEITDADSADAVKPVQSEKSKRRTLKRI